MGGGRGHTSEPSRGFGYAIERASGFHLPRDNAARYRCRRRQIRERLRHGQWKFAPSSRKETRQRRAEGRIERRKIKCVADRSEA
jgi:hypothetical protein